MNADGDRSPVEDRLDEHMEMLRRDPPTGGTALAVRVGRRARWQAALRRPLGAAALLLGAAVHGLAILVGVRRTPR